MIYLVTYDLNRPGQNYSAVTDAIKRTGDWWHYLESTWLVHTNLMANGIWSQLAPEMDKNDRVLITHISRDFQGRLPSDAWVWIEARIDRPFLSPTNALFAVHR